MIWLIFIVSAQLVWVLATGSHGRGLLSQCHKTIPSSAVCQANFQLKPQRTVHLSVPKSHRGGLTSRQQHLCYHRRMALDLAQLQAIPLQIMSIGPDCPAAVEEGAHHRKVPHQASGAAPPTAEAPCPTDGADRLASAALTANTRRKNPFCSR
jgi:hypothetical protein